MTKLQEFLRDGGTLEQLKEKYALRIKQHPKYPNLWQFKYDQIESPMGEPLVCECRGIILDEARNWEVVARPFDKFFNLGEGHQATIDWNTARITEKLDGSLAILYHYDGQWQVATSGTPDAGGEVNGFGMTFAQLFWEVFGKSGMNTRDLEDYDSNYTYLFELCTPFNRIVVPHKESKVVLIGIRNRNNGKEIPPVFGPKGWPFVAMRPVGDAQDIINTFQTMNALDQEGWVVVDENFNRVKVKHPQYVVLHHMRGEGSPSPKKALEVILKGEHEELLTYWPEWRPLFEVVNNRLALMAGTLELQYVAIRHIESQKEFALEACKTRCSGALFSLRAGKVESARQFIANMKLDNVVSLLELDNILPTLVTAAIRF